MGSSRADEAVAHVELWKGREVHVSPLSGGLTNENYLVQVGGARYVMRLPGRSTELLSIDRANEIYNTRAAAINGIGPRVIEHVPELDVMVLEYIDGATMSASDLQSEEMVLRMGASFRRLHSGLSVLARLRHVPAHRGLPADRRRAPGHDPARLSRPDAARGRDRTCGERGALPARPCHNDLLCENFIDDGEVLRIVDFELSGNNDPCFDLGNTAQEAQLDQEMRAALCRAYFGRLDVRQLARMNLYALMSDIGWTLWGAIQARISTVDFDFVAYYTGRWSRALEVIEFRSTLRLAPAGARGLGTPGGAHLARAGAEAAARAIGRL